MPTAVGIFATRERAEEAAARLVSLGFPRDAISLLIPGAVPRAHPDVPTTEAEPPGVGVAIGGVVGGAAGAATGWAITSLVVPGIGPVLALGAIGAALLGVGGGAAVGASLDANLRAGLPKDELHAYESALREGHSVMMAMADDEDRIAAARAALRDLGAESVDAARERWHLASRQTRDRAA